MACPIKFCKNYRKKFVEGLKWHLLPPQNDPRRKLWLELCEKENYGNSTKVCSDHFKPTDYFDFTAKKRALKPNAVPIASPDKNGK